MGSRSRRWLAAIVATAVLFATGASAAGVEATCELAVTGSSGLGPWTNRVPALRVSPTSSATPGRWNAVLVIPVSALDAGDKVRDTTMHDMFESRTWPEIRAELRDVSPAEAEQSLRLPVSLTIRDQVREVEAVLTGWKRSGDRIEFEADVPVSLEAFSLEAPMVLGLSRVNDEVKIHAKVVVGGLAAGK